MRLLPLSLRVRLGMITAAAVTALAVQGACAGCSEECSGENQGAETCPCQSDQDCTTQLDTVLLCVDGACAIEEPPAADPELGACDADGQCGLGQACGVDEICFAAARCQRIEVDLRFRNSAGDEGDVTASAVNGCAHAWSVDAGAGGAFDATFEIDLEGNFTNLQGCDAGRWFAADRVGELVCGDVRWAIASGEPNPVATCLGDCAEPCVLVGEAVGVCP